MRQKFGQRELAGYAKVYAEPEAVGVELKHIVRRDKGEKAEMKAKEAKKAPQPKKQ